MSRRWRSTGARELAALAVVVMLAACADGSDDAPVAASLCPTVQAWSDSTVGAVNGFRIASRSLDPDGRRARYAQTFDELGALHDRLADELADLDLSDAVGARLDTALDTVDATVVAGAVEADGLPDAAYEFVAVRDGSLVTGVEKAKAVVFAGLGELARDPTTGVPPGCGRRGALDLSPAATFPR